MKQHVGFVKTTVIGGLVFLAPIVVLLLVIQQALAVINKVLLPFEKLIPIESVGGVLVADVIGIAALLGLCFAAGLLARRARLKGLVDRIEKAVLTKLPGYQFIKGMGETMIGLSSDNQHQAVLARFDDGWQFGFEMERLDDGHVVVFIPGAPAPFSGAVFVMAPDRIRVLENAQADTLHCLKAMGIGANTLLQGKAVI
ncbi:MAG: DUF502 domain-containing protein [Gammaproteobacteria bacterium]|nr:MAG: DUF502 domain-containing protein [Gammaproteobacteria bacterium]